MKNGEIASFGEQYKGQFDRDFYIPDEKGKSFLQRVKGRQIHR